MVIKHKYVKEKDIYPPENSVYEGVNGLSKCFFCFRRIPKNIYRHTKEGGYYKDNHNICASCLIKMVKAITKKKGQKKLVEEWDRITFLKILVGE